MKAGLGKTVNLRDIILNVQDLPDLEDELEAFGRRLYSDLFFAGERPGIHLLHDGEKVRFDRRRFTHAFSKADNWKTTKEKTGLDKRRYLRANWILPMIQGQVSGSECWLITEFAKRKRIYVCFKQGYVVWLESNNKGKWSFSSAYTASAEQIRGYIRGGEKIASFGKKKSP